MDCEEARRRMLEARRRPLSGAARAALDGHVSACDACKQEEAVDAVLSDALSKLTAEPTPAPPSARILDVTAASGRLVNDARTRARRRVLLGLVALSGLAALLVTFPRGYAEPDPLVNEAVNDHVRVLSAARPVEVEGTTLDQISPALAAKLDFAPTNAFAGDATLPLAGGSVAYFIDRRAAAFVYARDVHAVTVLVFRADGLPFRGGGERRAVTVRGFRAVVFRHGDLGYAVISDLSEAALLGIAAKVDGS